jgi:hypothetical protein
MLENRDIKIGVFTGAMVAPDAQPADAPAPAPELKIVEPPPAPEPGAPASAWPLYCDWRKTKCPSEGTRSGLEDLDQSIHEFVGEVSEFAQVLAEADWTACIGDTAKRLLFEAGDVFFCGCWVMDASGLNPLRDVEGTLALRDPSAEGQAEDFAGGVIARLDAEGAPDEDNPFSRDVEAVRQMLTAGLLGCTVRAGLLCDTFKKGVWQRRQPDVSAFFSRVLEVFYMVEQILGLFGATTEMALKANVQKLDTRYPEGWKPGGGVRKGGQ